jgi:NodT family efflux transporter outer membrane factor (OMF) lipoprotein
MRRAALTAVLLLINAGCAVGPNYRRPSAPVDAAFKEAPPEGWKVAQPNEAVPRGRWWEIFNNADLNALESTVALSNQNVIAAMAQYREARDQIRLARSNLFPTVTITPSVTVQHFPANSARVSGVNATSSSGTVVDVSLPVDVSYQADVWSSIRRSITAAGATAQASAADLENAQLTYQAQLAQFFFQLHGLDADIDLLERTVALYQQSLQLTKDRRDAGVASDGDVAQAEAQLASAQAQLIDLGVGRAQFEHAIAVLTGRPPSEVTIARAIVNIAPPPVPVGVPSSLLERRPDVTAMERTVAAANEQIGIAKAAFFPALTLSGSTGSQSTPLSQFIALPISFWSVGPQLAQTLFDAGRRRAQVDLNEAAYDAAVANYRQTVLNALQQVEDQLSALRILEQEESAQNDAVDASRRSLDIANAQYTAGTVNYLQVITAQTTALQNERAALDLLTRRLVASVLLIESLGGGWDVTQLPQ